jgi:peptide/nickel transport system permease protein
MIDKLRVMCGIRRGSRILTRAPRHVPLIPVIILFAFVLAAIFADFIRLHDPCMPSLSARLHPPFWQMGGGFSYPLGTDALGRDIFSRIIYGARVSLLVALFSLSLGGFVGTLVALISGYYQGKVGAILMRAADSMIGFPIIFLALLLAVVLGPGLINIVIAFGAVLWARFARLIRGEVLSLRERDFIAQAHISGCSAWKIMTRHLFPNILNTLVVALTLQVGWVILVEASLSFLGAGVPPPTPSWGGMVAQGRSYVVTAWWVPVFPGLAILLVCMSCNLFGDWLRDTLDPKLRSL